MLSEKQRQMVALFEKHVGAELEGDLDTTLNTMSDDPHLHNVPTMVGGFGRAGVRAFYRDRLVGQFFPPDVQMQNVSRTVGEDHLVDELVISFTHTRKMDWMLPGVAPTGAARWRSPSPWWWVSRTAKSPMSTSTGIKRAVLVQIGLLDPAGLPVVGAESARRVLDPKLPPRTF